MNKWQKFGMWWHYQGHDFLDPLGALGFWETSEGHLLEIKMWYMDANGLIFHWLQGLYQVKNIIQILFVRHLQIQWFWCMNPDVCSNVRIVNNVSSCIFTQDFRSKFRNIEQLITYWWSIYEIIHFELRL